MRSRAVRAEERPGFALAADALLAGETAELPEPRLDFLDWLAAARRVVFHGSQRDDLTLLSTERRSTDTTAWGNPRAVYASSDPVWAIYFAVLRREGAFRGTRNGSIRVGGRRFYFFLHNRGSASPDRFRPGSLYLLPGDTFTRQPAPVDLAHLVSHEPVVPLARVDVTPLDFPFRDRIRYYREREPVWISMFRP